jgi:hypothetical protein
MGSLGGRGSSRATSSTRTRSSSTRSS